MAGIFDEANMNRVLGDCLPEGEILQAGIHGITLQVNKKKHPILTCISASPGSICWLLNARNGNI